MKNLLKAFISCTFLSAVTLIGFSEEKKLIIIGEEFAPFEFMQDGRAVGIDIDIATLIFSRLNIPIEVRLLPWKRAWHNAENGLAGAILTTSRKITREPYLWYPKEDMWSSDFVFFVKKDNLQPDFNGYESAKKHKLKIGVVHGNSYHPSFWEAFPYTSGETTFQGDLSVDKQNPQLHPVTKFEQSLKMLNAGRLDLVIADKTVGSYTVKLLGLHNKLTYYDKPLYSKGYPMAFIKKFPYRDLKNIADKFEAELVKIKKSGEYQKIFDKWLK